MKKYFQKSKKQMKKLSEHEVYKFLLIFHTLVETVNSAET